MQCDVSQRALESFLFGIEYFPSRQAQFGFDTAFDEPGTLSAVCVLLVHCDWCVGRVAVPHKALVDM